MLTKSKRLNSMMLAIFAAVCMVFFSFGVQASVVPAELQGEWTSYYNRHQFVFYKYDVSISEQNVVETISFVAMTNLAPADGEFMRVTYSVNGITTPQQNQDVKILELTLKRYESAAAGAWSAQDLSLKRHCGLVQWSPGEFKDLTNRSCGEGSGNIMRSGTRSKKYFMLKDGKLYLKKPLSNMGEEIPESQLDLEHPLFLK